MPVDSDRRRGWCARVGAGMRAPPAITSPKAITRATTASGVWPRGSLKTRMPPPMAVKLAASEVSAITSSPGPICSDRAEAKNAPVDGKWRPRDGADVQSPRHERHEPADGEPPGPEQRHGAVQGMAEADRRSAYSSTELEEEREVRGQRGGQCQDETDEHRIPPPSGERSSSRGGGEWRHGGACQDVPHSRTFAPCVRAVIHLQRRALPAAGRGSSSMGAAAPNQVGSRSASRAEWSLSPASRQAWW